MRHTLSIALLALAVVLTPGCRKKDQPAETGTLGNATDRNPATGTTGTGEPASVGTDTANAAQQLGTAGTVAVSGTEEVHGATTQTTSTMAGPNTTRIRSPRRRRRRPRSSRRPERPPPQRRKSNEVRDANAVLRGRARAAGRLSRPARPDNAVE